MNIKYRTSYGVILFFLISTNNVMASFDEGMNAYNDKNYRLAVTEFIDSSAENPKNASIFYMLGLSYQKLDLHEDAVEAFKQAEQLDPSLDNVHLALGTSSYESGQYKHAEDVLVQVMAEEPDNSSAMMLLGLSELKLGKSAAGINHLERAADLDPELQQLVYFNIGLEREKQGNGMASRVAFQNAIAVNPDSDLANGLRERMQSSALNPRRTFKKFFLTGKAGIEFDDNVTTNTLDLASNEGDAATIFEVSAGYNPLLNGRTQLELGYDFYQSLYWDLSDFDLQLHNFSATGTHDLGNVELGMAYIFSYARLGGDVLMNSHNLIPGVSFNFVPNWRHTLTYNFQDKDFMDFAARDAVQHAANFNSIYILPDERSYATIGFRYENENASSPIFDYNGYALDLGYSRKIHFLNSDDTQMQVGYQYSLRDYSAFNPFIGSEREDNRHKVTLTGIHPVTEKISLELNYRYIGSNSNLVTADYNENIMTLFVRGEFW